jgi:hypothetical protein
MNPFARIIVGYHGCESGFAERLFAGHVIVDDWQRSENDHDWLGHGIYFWEYAPERAMRWAVERCKRRGGEPSVIGAIIQLGICLDLTNERDTANLRIAYELVRDAYAAAGQPMPVNGGNTSDLKARRLDCLVINYFRATVASAQYQTVRGVFPEGVPAYDGAMIMSETHVQVAVVDQRCILGVFRPTYVR